MPKSHRRVTFEFYHEESGMRISDPTLDPTGLFVVSPIEYYGIKEAEDMELEKVVYLNGAEVI